MTSVLIEEIWTDTNTHVLCTMWTDTGRWTYTSQGERPQIGPFWSTALRRNQPCRLLIQTSGLQNCETTYSCCWITQCPVLCNAILTNEYSHHCEEILTINPTIAYFSQPPKQPDKSGTFKIFLFSYFIWLCQGLSWHSWRILSSMQDL